MHLPPSTTLTVIGAGQAGLSAAYFLRRLLPDLDFLVLDKNDAPGGAWLHRWPSLTLQGAHRIHPLPGFPLRDFDPSRPASEVVSEYFAAYEEEFHLPVLRPAMVRSVHSSSPKDPFTLTLSTPQGERVLLSSYLVSATGTWDQPHWPHYPGRSSFRGLQRHTHDFSSPEEFRGLHTLVVGAGTSALSHLLELEGVTSTSWFTRRPPLFTERPFQEEWGREVELSVAKRVEAGLPPQSVVSATGLSLTPLYQAAIDRGLFNAQPMFSHILPEGVLLQSKEVLRADAILWATGFRPALSHLAPLHLRTPQGGIQVRSTRSLADPRIFLPGYGPSASTLGASRAGRRVAQSVAAALSAR